MFQKIMKISDKLMQLDQREGLRQAADLFESESYLDGYINTIQAIYDYSHNYKYLEKIADYFLEKQQFNIAFSYYNKYLKQKNNSFYEKFLRTFPIEVRIDETREAQNPVLLKLIDLNMVMVHMIIFAHSKKLYDAVIQLSENLDIIKKEIDNFLQGRINYGDDISEVYDDYRLLSDVLSKTKKNNEINELAIKLNPQNKKAYLNIIDNCFSDGNFKMALDLYNKYSKIFNTQLVKDYISLCNALIGIYKDLGDFYSAIYYQKLELEFELGEK